MFIYVSPEKLLFRPSKEYKSKTINARGKTRTDLESASNSAQNCESRFSSYFLMIEDFKIKLQLLIFSPEKT